MTSAQVPVAIIVVVMVASGRPRRRANNPSSIADAAPSAATVRMHGKIGGEGDYR